MMLGDGGAGGSAPTPSDAGSIRVVVFGQLTVDELAETSDVDTRVEYAGDAPYAAVGAAIWQRPVGIVARAASDFDQSRLSYTEAHGIDREGVKALGSQAVRYRVTYRPDGERRFEERSPRAAFHETAPEVTDLPDRYRMAAGYHIAAMPLASATHIIESIHLAEPGALLTLDTHEDEVVGQRQNLASVLPHLTAFLPSRDEVRLLLGYDDPDRALVELGALGGRLVVLKMGADGSLLRDTAIHQTWHVPAFPTRVVDTTGAGDAYCGGFLAGLTLGDEPQVAACRATVSASYAVEASGVPKAPPDQVGARKRLEHVRASIVTERGPRT